MTFSEEKIKEISIDMDDEWQYMENDTVLSVKLYGLEEYAERFWQRKENYPDGWIDVYAQVVINEPNEPYVKQIEFVLITNNDTQDRYLTISFYEDMESRMIADKLFATSHGGLQQMVDDREVGI